MAAAQPSVDALAAACRRILKPIDDAPPEFFGFRPAVVTMTLGLADSVPHLLMMKRSQNLPTHAGQWAFPGGGIDPGETVTQAARREFFEEMGKDLPEFMLVGALMDAPTVSHYIVRALVAVGDIATIESGGFTPNEAEVSAHKWIKLADFAVPGKYSRLVGERGGIVRATHGFDTPGAYVWGASAELIFRFLLLSQSLDVDLGIAGAELLDPARDFLKRV